MIWWNIYEHFQIFHILTWIPNVQILFRLEAEAIYRAQLERYSALARSSLLPVAPYPSSPLLYNPGSELISPNPIISTASQLSTLLSTTLTQSSALSAYTQHLNSLPSSVASITSQHQVFQDAVNAASAEKINASEKSEPSMATITTPTISHSELKL